MIRKIGSGGMAVVYLATQDDLDRTVAIKVLRKSLRGAGEEFVTRFANEGRMLAALEHENIVKVYDVGSTDDAVYMVMEFLSGGTLSEKMQAGNLTVSSVIEICAKIGLALHAAHFKNIIHRDLKPANIMFRDESTPVLTDFGIARKTDADMSMTATGMMIGTPQYMSPEQIQGKPVDNRSDIYSLGLMFYRLLTGEMAFKATDPIALAMQQIQEPPPPLPSHLSELQPVLDLMLAKSPEDRYNSTLDFCNHLRSISLTGEDYKTELSTATRIFSTDRFSGKSRITGSRTVNTESGPDSAISGAFKSVGTAVSQVITRKKPRYVLLGILAAAVAGFFISTQFMTHGLSDTELKQIERELTRFHAYMDLDKIIDPPGENATESLERLRAIAPDFGRVEEAANELADYYLTFAYDDYDTGKLDETAAWITKGLAFVSDHEGLLELKESVDDRIAERDRLIRIDSLLAAGSTALERDNLLPPASGNAYDAFSEVRTLDLQNEVAEAGLSEIQRRITDQAREVWRTGQVDRAQQLVTQGLSLFSDSSLLLDLKSDIDLQLALEQQQQQLAELLTRAEEQFASGNLVEPAGNNALESYRQARDLRSDNPEAQAGLQKIADHFANLAQLRFDEGEFQSSLEAAANGLKAVPDDPSLLTAQLTATSRLNAREREIQTRLQSAERLVASGQFIPGQPGMAPEADNATQAFNELLEFDPDNAKAIEGLAGLSARVDNAISQYQREGKLAEARALAVAAQTQYGDPALYEIRLANIDRQLAERSLQQKLEASLAALDELFAIRPLTTELIDRIAGELRTVSGEFPDQVEVSERLSRFITMIGNEVDALSLATNDSEAIALADHALLLYPSNARLSSARSTVEQRRTEREAAERRRIAAMSGVLAIDASPWGRVIEVRNSDQTPQALPAGSDTPLSLTLLEGKYTVVLAGPDGESSYELQANVQRQQVATVRPEQSLMSAQDYFEKSGW
jgi:serine/threonine-protein kinase PpkA